MTDALRKASMISTVASMARFMASMSMVACIGGRRLAVSYATAYLPKFFAAFLVSAVRAVLFLCLSRRHFRTFVIVPVSARNAKHGQKLAAKSFGKKAVA